MRHIISKLFSSITALLPVAVLTLVSCGSEDEIPAGVIPSNEFFKIVGDTITIDGQATETSFSVTADCAWSIVTNGWSDLHATPDRGEGNQTVKIVTSTNDTPQMRKGTLTITTNEGITKVITVQQLAGNIQLDVSSRELNFGINGGSTEVAVTSNTIWTVAGGTDWCRVDKTSGTGNAAFTVTADKSDEKKERNATFSITAQGSTTPITINVSQSNKEMTLSVSPESLSFDATGEQKKALDIICNDRWTATVSHDWLVIDQITGSNDATIQVSCTNNSTKAERSGIVTIECSGLKKTVTVTQLNFNVQFSIYPTELPEFPATGGTQTITVVSNTGWDVSGGTDWCVLSKTDNSVSVEVKPNTLTTSRTATIAFIPTGSDPITLTVKQQAKAEKVIILNVDYTELSFGAAEESKTLTITCNDMMNYQVDKSWVALEMVSQTNEGEMTNTKVKVTCSANTTATEREATITISAGDKSQTVSVKQGTAEPPVVYNLAVTDTIDGKATLTANYRSALSVTEYGFVYATHATPTLEDTKVSFYGSNTTGDMTTTLTGLTIGTTYYVRAYAVSATGTAYSEELHFRGQGREPGQNDNGTPMPVRRK